MSKVAAVIGLCVVLLLPAAARAENQQLKNEHWSGMIPVEILQVYGVRLSWKDVSLHIPPGALNADTRITIRNRGPYGTREEVPELPRNWSTDRRVFGFYFSNTPNQPIPVFLKYQPDGRNVRHRIFFSEQGGDKWREQQTVVHPNYGELETRLPATEGRLVAAVRADKAEVPVRSFSYHAFHGTPFSKTAAVMDDRSGKFLYRQFAGEQRSIASITKLVTSMVFLESNPDLHRVISYSSSSNRIGAAVYVDDGEQITLKQALMGALIPSANNMAVTLSKNAGWPPENLFVVQMNNRMQELGLLRTSFVEPTGLDARNVSTAGNLTRLASYLFNKYPEVYKEAAAANGYEFYTFNTNRRVWMNTTNKFSGSGRYELMGFKTGYLPGSADRTLVVKVRQISTGHTILISLLGNEHYDTIFWEANLLADWAFSNWEFHNYDL